MQEDQRRETVSAKRAPPVVAGVSRKLCIDMPRRVATLPTTAEHFRDGPGRDECLRRIAHEEARVRAVGSGRSASVANAGAGREVQFQYPH